MPPARNDRLATAVVRNSTPGFPEIVARNPQCKLCTAAGVYPAVLAAVHDLMRQGLGPRVVAARVAPVVKGVSGGGGPSGAGGAGGAGGFRVTKDAVARHAKHVDFSFARAPDVSAAAAAAGTAAPATAEAGTGGGGSGAASPGAAEARAAAERARARIEAGDELGDYFELWTLFERLRTHLDTPNLERALQEPPADDTEEGKQAGRRVYAYMLWIKTIKEARQLLEVINRVRIAERWTRALAKAVLKDFAVHLSTGLRAELASVRSAIREGRHDLAAARIDALLDGAEIVTYFDEAESFALQKSEREFRAALH